MNLNVYQRSSLIATVLSYSSTQRLIEFPAANLAMSHDRTRKISSSRKHGDRLREMILSTLGKRARTWKTILCPNALCFVQVNVFASIVAYISSSSGLTSYISGGEILLPCHASLTNLTRPISTEHTQTLLTPALLTRFRKRSYPFYSYTRTPNIWSTREDLLAYESALQLEASVLGLIDRSVDGIRKEGSSGPLVERDLAHDPIDKVHLSTPVTEQNKENLREEEATSENDGEQEPKAETDKIKHARIVSDIFVTRIYPRWRELVRERKAVDGPCFSGLDRFDCGKFHHSIPSINPFLTESLGIGHVYTRMVHKCTRVLAMLKQHRFELEVLENLLAQRLWLRGKRGKWHNRRVLILMRYCGKEGHAMRKALDAAVEALEDSDTHLC